MTIDETLKNNLIADIENTWGIELGEDIKTSLKRAFEITIGCYYLQSNRIIVSEPDIKHDVPYYFIERDHLDDLGNIIVEFYEKEGVKSFGIWFNGLNDWTNDPEEAMMSTNRNEMQLIMESLERNRVIFNKCRITEHLFMSEPESLGSKGQVVKGLTVNGITDENMDVDPLFKKDNVKNEQLTCPHTYHTKTGYCKYRVSYNAEKDIR